MVTPSATTIGGYSYNTSIPPDPQFAGIPSTAVAADQPASTVLLPNLSPGGAASRYVLGPAALGNSSVASASAQLADGQWLVTVTLNPTGTAAWGSMARAQFHSYVAIDVNAAVVSVSLIEPTNLYYTTIGTQLTIGGLTQPQAQTLAREIGVSAG